MLNKLSNRLSTFSVMILCVAAVLIAISILFPWWGMEFVAPQYPEGLNIIVYPYKMEGQIDIVNGLNHYIGMKGFSEQSFPELQYLPFIIGGMALLTLVTALSRKTKFVVILIVLFTIGGIIGLWDIHRWLTDFGTNLDPMAPITIDPFVPPVLGNNTLANFVTTSYFSTGSYLLGIAFLMMLFTLWRERRNG